jgi:hypothetical protein
MFADTENVKSNPIGKLDLFQQVVHALNGREVKTRGWVRDGCGEAVNADLHLCHRNLAGEDNRTAQTPC